MTIGPITPAVQQELDTLYMRGLNRAELLYMWAIRVEPNYFKAWHNLGTINYTVNSFAKNMEGSLTLFGDKGTVKIGGQYLNVLEYQQFEDYCIVGIKESAPANDYGHYQGSMSNHDLVYKNILDVLDGHSTIGVSGIEGRKSVALIEQLYRTARNADGRTAYPA